MSSNILPFHVAVDGFPLDHFRVLSFTGREAMSKAYWFNVVTAAKSAEDAERSPLGRRAVLTWNVGPAPRAFYAIVAASRVDDRDGNVKVHLRLVPRLWLLGRRLRTRIFQHQRVHEIVTAVLAEHGIAARWKLERSYPVREYCTQYEETDYHFVRRILAEAAIFFYFPAGPPLDDAALAAGWGASAALEVAGAVGAPLAGAIAEAASPVIPGDTFVGVDGAAFYPPIGGDDPGALLALSAAVSLPGIGGVSVAANVALTAAPAGPAPTLYYQTMLDDASPEADKVSPFAVRGSVRSNRAEFRDYDPERPLAPLRSVARSAAPFPSPPDIGGVDVSVGPLQVSVTAEVGGAAGAAVSAFAGAAGELLGQAMLPLELYEHHGPHLFPKWAYTEGEAAQMLRQARRRAVVAEGGSGCSALAPGHRFSLADHPVAHLDGPYAVTMVEHRGEAGARAAGGEAGQRVYTNTFACVPASMPFVPKRPKRKSIQVALTATVVGPRGEEIHVDPMGQIKVQFHWDREGKHDDRSSCWIRTMHPWGGTGWGVQFIPRVGMEVVVTFEGGDPDKPMVIGALYNGTHPTAFPLPGDKSRSGFRTNSYPGGGGFNEISFEDARGQEQIFLHAERDHDEVVLRNHTRRVGVDETIAVGHDQRVTVGASRTEIVALDQTDRISGNCNETIGADHTVHVAGTQLVASLDAQRTTRRHHTTVVAGNERLEVGGRADQHVKDDLTVRVDGNLTTIVGKQDARRTHVVHAEGRAVLESTEQTEVGSDKELVLRCGDSKIRLTPDRIEFSSKAGLSLRSGNTVVEVTPDKARIRSKGGKALISAEEINLLTDEEAQVKLTEEVKITGLMVKLNPPVTDKDKDDDPKPPTPTKIALKDSSGRPLANQRFVIHLGDGSEVAGVLDHEGSAELEIEGGGPAKIAFPEVRDVE